MDFADYFDKYKEKFLDGSFPYFKDANEILLQNSKTESEYKEISMPWFKPVNHMVQMNLFEEGSYTYDVNDLQIQLNQGL
jgi:hypothetical protein